jgi:S-DNA-T family DNA segregation ATPase FtsK/SpoIIIE
MIDISKKILHPVTALLLFVIGLVGFVGLASYNPFDPSWDFQTASAPKNFAGLLGANVSSIYLAFIGYSGYFISLVFFIWGIKLFQHWFKPIPPEEIVWYKAPYAKVLFLVLSLIFISGAIAGIDELKTLPEAWVSNSHGGHIGYFLKDKLTPVFGKPIFLSLFSIFGIICGLLALGLSVETWKLIFQTIYFTIINVSISAYYQTKRFINWLLKVFGKEAAILEQEKIEPVRKPRKITSSNTEKQKKQPAQQTSFDLEMSGDFQLPPLSLLSLPEDTKAKKPSESSLSANAEMLEKVLDDFGVKGKIIEVQPGPVVTLYSFEPAPGTKSSRVIGLADDIARSMTATSARISVIAGINAIGIELPNSYREKVFFKELMLDPEFKKSKAALPLILGKDISGKSVIIDLARTPHLLVAGTTGSGKSVGLNGMILSLLFKYSPEECKFIMIDPKMLELSVYQDIPHLLSPVVTEPQKAIVALKWVVKEMENRYRLMSNLGVRNLDGYNEKIVESVKAEKVLTRTVQTGYDSETGKPTMEEVELEMKKLPFIVVIVDEMADLMIVAGKEIEGSIQRLAQMARAAGIHIILATQRPSVDVITGVIKANFPSRISFQVTSKIDSRTILGEQGAEQLLGMGDMLYMASGSKITRVHGPFVSDDEVRNVAEYLKTQAKPVYVEEVTTSDEELVLALGEGGGEDDLYNQAVAVVLRDKKVSTSYLQRVFKIGYNKAANIIEQMEKQGVISEPDHVGRRQILLK